MLNTHQICLFHDCIQHNFLQEHSFASQDRHVLIHEVYTRFQKHCFLLNSAYCQKFHAFSLFSGMSALFPGQCVYQVFQLWSGMTVSRFACGGRSWKLVTCRHSCCMFSFRCKIRSEPLEALSLSLPRLLATKACSMQTIDFPSPGREEPFFPKEALCFAERIFFYI